jgi:acyl-CoA thioester hydrolase
MAGKHAERTYLMAVRVYYEDTDGGGIVYHANYLQFAERARTEMLRSFGLNHRGLLSQQGIALVVRHLVADFRTPARLDDWLDVGTQVTRVRGASFDVAQSIRRDGIDLVRLRVKLACMTPDGRVARLPAVLRSSLAAAANETGGSTDGR